MKEFNLKLLLLTSVMGLSACGGGGGGDKTVPVADDPQQGCTLTTCNGGDDDDDGDDDGDDGGGDDGGGNQQLEDLISFANQGLTSFVTITPATSYARTVDFSANDFDTLFEMNDYVYDGITGIIFNTNIVQLDMSMLSNFISLEDIESDSFNAGLCSLSNLTSLTRLSIPSYASNSATPALYEDISCISQFSNLTELNLFNANVESGTSIDFLNSLQDLTYIDARMVEFSGVTTETINKANMSYVDLNGSTSETAISLSDFTASYDSLSFLDLKTISITDIQELSNFTALSYLALTLPNDFILDENSGEDLDALYANIFTGSTNLTHLDLSDSGSLTTPAVFRNFASLENRPLLTLLLNGNYTTIDSLNDGYLNTLTRLKNLDLSNSTIDSNQFLGSMLELETLTLKDISYNVDPVTAFDFLGSITFLREFEFSTTSPFEAFDTGLLNSKPDLEKVYVDINPRDPSLTGTGLPFYTPDFVATSPKLRSFYLRGSVTDDNINLLYDNDFDYLNLSYSLMTDYNNLDNISMINTLDNEIGEIILPIHGNNALIIPASVTGNFCQGWAADNYTVTAPLPIDSYCQ